MHIVPQAILQYYMFNKKRLYKHVSDSQMVLRSVLACCCSSAMNSSIFPSIASYSGSVSTVGSSGKNRGFLSSRRYLTHTQTHRQTHTHTHTHTHTDTDSVLEDSVTVDKPNTLMQMCERTSESKSLTFL